MTSSYIIIAAIILCIALSAFFSASEMAYSSCNMMRLEKAEEEGDKGASRAIKIANNFDRALSTILIGNNLVNIAASSLGSVLVFLLTGSDEDTWIATVVITLLVIIFGETMAKIVAKKNANRFAISNSFAVTFLMYLFYPVVALVVFLVNLITSRLKEEQSDDDEAVEELQSIIETAEDEEVIDKERSELVQAAIDFSDISVSEVMTARVDVEAIDIEDDKEAIDEFIAKTNFSRIPVYEGTIDNVIGTLSVTHYLKALIDDKNADLRSLLMPPCYIYKTVKLPDALDEFKQKKQHMMVVSDEYGGTLGVVTMEDVLEEIVGEIWDDTDEIDPEIIERKDGEYELDGDLAISELIELMDLNEDEFDAESETVGGWTMEQFGGFPKEGDTFDYENISVKVLSMDERRVEKILVRKLNDEELAAKQAAQETADSVEKQA